MKIRVTFKTPDALTDAIQDLSYDDQILARRVAEKYMEYEEYITVEFDLERGTCAVVPKR
jgi:hypothetical protein